MSAFYDLVDEMALGQMLKAAEPAMAAQLLDITRSGPPHVRREALAAVTGAPSSSRPARLVVRPRQAAQVWEDDERSAQNLDRMSKALDATIAAIPARALEETREERIARVRATAVDVMAKAMAGFEDGSITAKQVNYLETVCGNMVQAHVEARS